GTEEMMRRTTLAVCRVLAAFILTGFAAAGVARADEAAGHYNLALQYKREGKPADAIAECEKAVSLRPDYAAAHLTRGNLYRAQNDLPRAAGELEKAAKLQPKDSTAHANLGAVYVRMKRLDDGIRE